MKKLIQTLTAIALLSTTALVVQAASLEQIKASGELKFGLEAQYRPFEFRNDKNEIIGYDIDLGTAFAKSIGVKAAPVDTNWSTVLQSLYNGDFNMILGGMTATEKRFAKVNFSVPYMDAASGIMFVDGGAANFAALDGKSVAAGAGTPQIQQMQDCAALVGIEFKGDIQTLDNDALAYQAMKTGRIDAYASTIVSLLEGQKAVEGLSATPWNCDGAFPGEWTAAAFRKGDEELRGAFNDFIADAKQSGLLKELQMKWFGQSFVNSMPDEAPTW